MKGSFFQEGKNDFRDDRFAAAIDHGNLTRENASGHHSPNGENQEHMRNTHLEQQARAILYRLVSEMQRDVPQLSSEALSLDELRAHQRLSSRLQCRVDAFKNRGHDLLITLLPEIKKESISLEDFKKKLDELKKETEELEDI